MPGAFDPPKQPEDVRLAISAWNILGGLEWSGLPVVAEMLGYTDIEKLVAQLVTIRDHGKKD